MNVPMIEMTRADASEKFREYQTAVRQHHRNEDLELMRGFRELRNGNKLIDVHAAMKFAGLNERQQPKLAICRADTPNCWFKASRHRGSGYFTARDRNNWHWRASKEYDVKFPVGTFKAFKDVEDRVHRAIVPSIPPRLRPKIAYSNLHILWEAEWETVPTDPLLLRRISGFIFVVLAHWDLTELEKAVLKRAL